jgi:chemotaxis signal transduction protein
MKELLLFQAGNIQFGLNLPLVKSIQSVNARLAEQEGGGQKLVQVMDGEELPIYDLPTILTDEASSVDPMSQKVILVDAHEHPIALGVDRVKQVVSVSSDRIHPLPLIFNGLSQSCFPQVLKHEDGLILLVNPKEIENLETMVPGSENNTPEPEVQKSSPEEKEVLGPSPPASSVSINLHQDSNQESEMDHAEPTSAIPYSGSASPDEPENDPSDLKDTPSEPFDLNANSNEVTAHEDLLQKESFRSKETCPSDKQEQIESESSSMETSFADTLPDTNDSDMDGSKEEAVAADVNEIEPEISKEPFQSENSIITDEQGEVEPEPSEFNARFEDMTPTPEEDDTQDAEEATGLTDIDDMAAETLPYEEIIETGTEGGYFELRSNDHPAAKSHEDDPDETQYTKEIHEVEEENQLLTSIGINLDADGKPDLALEEAKPLNSDGPSQVASVQTEEIASLKEAEGEVESLESESTDHLESTKEDKDMPRLPLGEVPYLFAAISTESEPVPKESAEGVSLKKAETIAETLEEESPDPFRSAKEDKEMPRLPVGEVPHLFAAVSTESELTPKEPDEEVSLKKPEAEVEVPELKSTDHFRFAEEDTAALIMPVSEEPSLLNDTSIEPEQLKKESPHAILLDSSDIVMPESVDRFEKVLAQTRLPRELAIDDGKQKGSYRGRITAAVVTLVAILLLSIWLLPKSSLKVSEVVRKPIPMAYTAPEVRTKPPERLQTPQSLNTSKKASAIEYESEKSGEEILKIETKDFTLTVERPKATDKNGRPSAGAGMTGENEYSHIVVKNDTLWQIAERYLDDPFRYPELAERSRIIDPDRIYPGDVVRIVTKNEQSKLRKGKSSH